MGLIVCLCFRVRGYYVRSLFLPTAFNWLHSFNVCAWCALFFIVSVVAVALNVTPPPHCAHKDYVIFGAVLLFNLTCYCGMFRVFYARWVCAVGLIPKPHCP